MAGGSPATGPDPPLHVRRPTLTCVVAAYRESGVIEAKIADLLSQEYPPTIEVVVVAEDSATADAARRAGARVVQPPDRIGKSAALGLGVEAGTGEVIVVSDANVHLAPGSLCAMARWFEDPAVRAVAGEKYARSPEGGSGEGVYWAFESRLKQWENRLGSSVCPVGELGAVRRSLWRNIPAEDPSPTLADDVQRRPRIVAGALAVLWRRRALLHGYGQVSVQLWGHKVVRSALAPSAHVILAAGSLRAARRGPRRAPFAWLIAMGHVVGVGATRRTRWTENSRLRSDRLGSSACCRPWRWVDCFAFYGARS